MRICLSECFEVNATFDWLNKYLRARVCHLFSLRKSARLSFFKSSQIIKIIKQAQQFCEDFFCEFNLYFLHSWNICVQVSAVKNIEGQFGIHVSH